MLYLMSNDLASGVDPKYGFEIHSNFNPRSLNDTQRLPGRKSAPRCHLQPRTNRTADTTIRRDLDSAGDRFCSSQELSFLIRETAGPEDPCRDADL